MKDKIYRMMLAVTVVTMVLCTSAVTFIMYDLFHDTMKTTVQTEAFYVASALNMLEDEDITKFETPTNRITLIAQDGTVLYETTVDAQELENHLERPEVQDALTTGYGESERLSTTLDEKTYYYAIQLDSGEVLRLSCTVDSVYSALFACAPYLLGISAFILILVVAVAALYIKKIAVPINNLNLEDPLSNNVYPELMPLLQRIDQQNNDQKAAEQIRREFSANVSHELKTPLTSISGFAEIMKDGIAKPEDMKHFAQLIYNETNTLKDMVEDIIKISRLDESNVEMPKEPVDMLDLAESVVTRLEHKSEKHKVSVEIVGNHHNVLGVPQMLTEIVYNLVSNAIKYNVENGKVVIAVYKMAEGVVLSVSDTGIGVAPEEQERIFERFFRVDKSHSKDTGGSGLGLSIVKHSANYHNATISINSALGEGTEIKVLFPTN